MTTLAVEKIGDMVLHYKRLPILEYPGAKTMEEGLEVAQREAFPEPLELSWAILTLHLDGIDWHIPPSSERVEGSKEKKVAIFLPRI